MFQTAPTNLYEYYTAQNKALPSVAERGQLFEQQGLGKAVDYRGTAEQNIALLGKLPMQSQIPKTSTPSIITTDDVRTGFNENVNNLNQRLGIPTPATPQPSQEGENLATPNFLNISTLNPALQNLSGQMNTLLTDFQAKGGTLTPEMQSRINQINAFELEKGSALVGAKTAVDEKDVRGTDESMGRVKEIETAQQESFNKLIEELKTTRQTFIESLTPTERETELKRKLNTLRTERQLLPLELRQEGISAAGIAGRQVEDERVMAIQEQNLLLELGLEKESREFKTSVLEKQVGFITDDLNLQFKIQDRLDKQEKDVLEQARNLRKDSLSALSDILDSFEGLAYEDLDAESQSEVLDIAKQFNIPLNLLVSAMKNAKQQKIFENSLKLKKAEDDGAAEKPLSLWEIDQFNRKYGWTPPYGFTQSQLIQFMDDNPNATPEELEAGAKQSMRGDSGQAAGEPQTTYIEAVGEIMNSLTDSEMDILFQKAKTKGITSFWRGKWNDVKAFIESQKDLIEQAIEQGATAEDIKQAFIE